MRRGAVIFLVVGIAGLALGGCEQQPYRVFAVQVASGGAAGAAAAAPEGAQVPVRESAGGRGKLTAQHPQWDLNRAPAALLGQLPGADGERVEAIVAGRPYRDKRELLRRGIVTPAEYAQWKAYLRVARAPAARR